MTIAVLLALLVHPVHETISEIQWNRESGRLEVAMRLDVLDQQWLSKRYSRSEPESRWATRYLRGRFRVTPRPQNQQTDETKYHWIGRQAEGRHVWWYFEIEPPDRQPPKWIEHRVLLDREHNYVNRVVILDGVKRRALTLTQQRPKQNLPGE